MSKAKRKYTPYTPEEAARALKLEYELGEAEIIAREMLSGATRFTNEELSLLAEFKDVSVEQMLDLDDAFAAYRDPTVETRKEIARKLFKKGFDEEFAAEITGLPLDKIMGLKNTRRKR